METSHRVVVGDSRDLDEPPESVDLVVTSPPYPMIEMWDDAFATMDPAIAGALDADDGDRAFELMHAQLDRVWDQVVDALAPGGVACVNVGDATRTLDEFRVYQNHARIVRALTERGLNPLPDVLWRKPANSAAKFMGSGMLPTNAYATLEHEYVLVFRKGAPREFPPGDERRYESAYFWEERNDWFSDVWTDVRGIGQDLDGPLADGGDLRDRSAAYPFALPYRLINMYSVYGDTVLDPFLGTGTTTLAAMVAARDSVGYELEDGFTDYLEDRVAGVTDLSRRVGRERLAAHQRFVEECRESGDDLGYHNDPYDFPVRTRQERAIRLYAVDDVERDDGEYRTTHSPVEWSPNGRESE